MTGGKNFQSQARNHVAQSDDEPTSCIGPNKTVDSKTVGKAVPEQGIGREKDTNLDVVSDVCALMCDKNLGEETRWKICGNDCALQKHYNFERALEVRIDMQKVRSVQDRECPAHENEKALDEENNPATFP